MRLMNSEMQEIKEFFGSDIPNYAILSHTWGREEVAFQDTQGQDARSKAEAKAGYLKIQGCCNQAKIDGIKWVWIDTCCIDKTSSAELSEAINSMYAWYPNSQICYALLEDVPPLNGRFHNDDFRSARWFKRGWCLQELIAPAKIESYASNWTEIGSKRSLYNEIKGATGIPEEVILQTSSLKEYTIAEKMSWASERYTTREEDIAYCLLGIFGVFMPLLYGEGSRAFQRLQEENYQED